MWLITSDHKGFGFDFKSCGIYRLLVKKCIEKPLDKYTKKSWNNRYLVLKVLESDVRQRELEKLAVYYQTEKTIKTLTGKFVLNRKFDWYERKTDNINIFLKTDSDSAENCKAALENFKSYEMKIPELDHRIRKYISGKLIDLANEWRESAGDPLLTEKELSSMITLTDLEFHNDKTIEAYYDDGGIFWGHCIIAEGDSFGTLTDAYIAG